MRIKDARQTFLGIWVKKIIEGKPFEVWGGEQLRDFNYVDDVVEALLMAAIKDITNGCIFNLGSEEVINLKELAKLLIDVNGGGELTIREFPEDRKKIDIGDYYSDFSFIKAKLGWEPRTLLKNGLEKTISFYKDNYRTYL
jgi:nucleoside-diphosphate-sugar epimerase